ncbi:hypothetical protein [Sporichthya polymorpha]|uniref:hypothetical protein n=1 Tax=Sporichthya polymorpha TaxID=35751 RepID=UPI000376E532|nr:hypothetical protein [Sporichthya polymorpha]
MDLGQWLRLGWDRAGAWACVVLGVVALVVGWIGVSDKLYTAEQVPYVISAGFGGLFLLGLGGILWLSADLRDEWTQLDKIEDLLAAQSEEAGATAAPRADAPQSDHLVSSVK